MPLQQSKGLFERHVLLVRYEQMRAHPIAPVPIEFLTAAETLGLDPSTLDLAKQQQLMACMETDTYVIRLAAKQLRMLADHDGLDTVGIEEARIVGTRYNYGTERTLAQLKTDLKYGNFIVDRWHSYSIMLGATR